MAKIKPIHGEMSGSIGGNTWSNNKGGQYVRQRTKPTNPNSVRQQRVRSILATLTHNWASLTTAQQNAWTAWAVLNPQTDALGSSFIMSGQQSYISLNARLLDSGSTANPGPPSTPAPSAPTATGISGNTSTQLQVSFTPTPSGAGIKLVVWMTPPASTGRNPNLKQARLVAYSAANVASPVSLTTPFGLTTGLTTNVFTGFMDGTGQISPLQKTRVVLS